MWRLALCVFIGSGIGGVLRFVASKAIDSYMAGCSRWMPAWLAVFPWATFTVNVTGCFIIGLIYGAVSEGIAMSAEMRTLLTAGFCGGLTTFSTFSHENFLLFQSGNPAAFALYIALSVIAGIAAAWAGHTVIRII